MNCPKCAENGEVRKVYLGWYEKPEYVPMPFWDDFGVKHLHSLGYQRLCFACPRGHEWEQIQQLKCHCGWPDVRTGQHAPAEQAQGE